MPPLTPLVARPPGSVAEARLVGGARGPKRRWAVAGSVLLHVALLAALLLARRPERPLPIAPSYDLVFDNGGSATPPTAETVAPVVPSGMPDSDLPPLRLPDPPPEAPPDLQAEPAKPEPAPPEPAPPEPASPPELLPPEPAVPPPEPAPAATLPPEPAPPPAVPEVVPDVAPDPVPVPAPAPRPPSTVRLEQPDTPPTLTPQAMAPDLPALVPPPPLPPVAPRPRVQAQQRPAPGSFGAPMDLSFGAAPRSAAPRARGSRGIDLALGAPKPGPNKSEAFFDIRAANIGADWAQGLAEYWRRHRYYPQQAAQNGEDGTVVIQIVVNRLGRVESVEIKSRSGSPWLDMAALGTWRNAQLAPLPRENTDATISIALTISYLLIR